MRVWKLRGARLAVAAIALLAAGCGGGGAGAAGGSGGGADAGAISITEPSDGATVQVPFTLKFSSESELGPTERGVHHVHVLYDGDDSKYEVVEADTFEVKSLSAGKHTITASLRNADHSPAGAEAQISVEVTGGGSGGGTETTTRVDY